MKNRLEHILKIESVPYEQGGVDALVFTAEGDMRNVLNGAQSTFSASGMINAENVYRMNDQPKPQQIKASLAAAMRKDWAGAFGPIKEISKLGYSTTDIITTTSRCVK